MKISYNKTDKIKNYSHLSTIVEISDSGLSIAYYNKDAMAIKGVKIFDFKNSDDTEIASRLETIFSENIYNRERLSIFLDQKESLIIPDADEFLKDKEKMLDLFFGSKNNKSFSDTIKLSFPHTANAVNIYRVAPEIKNKIEQFIPTVKFAHSSSSQIEEAVKGMTVIFQNYYFKIILMTDSGFKFIKHFNYKTPADVSYFMLWVCKNYEVSPLEIDVIIKGMVDKDSNLFEEMEKYFRNINFSTPDKDVLLDFDCDADNLHFFRNLTHLVKCVS